MTRFGQSLDDLKRLRVEEIDSRAEVERQRFLTLLPGQAVVYAAKLREAHNYLSGQTGISDLVYLKAEAEADGVSVEDKALQISAKAMDADRKLAAIEAVRVMTKAAIRKAKTLDEANKALDAAVWPKPEE